jgi:adenylate cyclase
VLDLQNPNDDQLWYLPTLAAAYADPAIGRMDDARKVVKTILSLKPEFSTSETVSQYPYKTRNKPTGM